MKSKLRFKSRFWLWLTVLIFIGFIKIFSQSSLRIEEFYSTKFYYSFSKILRFFLGWIPFSIGDILYFLAGLWILFKCINFISRLFQKKIKWNLFGTKLLKLVFIFAIIYVVFNIFWGLNYNRKGIAWQLNIVAEDYDTTNLKLIQALLLEKVNATKTILVNNRTEYPQNKDLYVRAKQCYETTSIIYPFINYKNLSVKSSLYGWFGDYLGFTGYYNPFTGEAQVNTTVPKFLLPYIALHEMGHQLGYAKEDEANFSGYLAAANSHDTLFQYSAYLDLFVYANREIFFFDSSASKNAVRQLIPKVRSDLTEWKRFNEQYTSVIEPVVSWLYGKYLQENQQPKGLRSYNEVIATLIAYYKKFGKI